MGHPNIDSLRQADEAMERGDIETFFSFYTEDVITTSASGTSHPPLMAPVRPAESGPTRPIRWVSAR